VWSSGETLVIRNSMNKSEALTCKIELHRNSEQKKTTKPCKTKTAEILRILEIQNKFKTNLKQIQNRFKKKENRRVRLKGRSSPAGRL